MARILRHQLTENGQSDYAKPAETNGNTNDKPPQDFVVRVASIPLVKDSVSTAQAIANKTSIGRFALSTANSTFNSVAQYATTNKPKLLDSYYQTYLQPQIEKADAFGCRQLDTLQSKVPIINQPSAEIFNTIAEPSYQIINGVKVRIDNTIQTVTHPAQVVVKNANKTFSTAVDNLEGVVDKYLPPPASNGHTKTNGNVKRANKDTADQDNQVKRAYGVLNEASRRLTVKVTDQVGRSTSGIPKSREDVSQLALVKKLQENIKFVQDTLTESVKIYSEAAQNRLPQSVTSRAVQANDLLAQLTKSVQQQISGLTAYIKSPEVPDWLKQNVDKTVATINQQLAAIKAEFARTDINYTAKVKGVATKLQSQITPLLENLTSQIKVYADLIKEKAQKEIQYFGVSPKVKTD